MKLRIVLFIAVAAVFVVPQLAFCGVVEKIAGVQIAVEKLTGRGEDYEINFSGWIGSLKLDAKEKLILISEFSNIGGKISVLNGIYKITKMEEYDKNIDFECVDVNSLTEGIGWRGKIWVTDADEIKVEMVQKQSSRKWVNLSNYGRKFLKENGIEKLNLGI